MQTIFIPLDTLEGLALHLHGYFPTGRAVAVTLDLISRNEGDYDKHIQFLDQVISGLRSEGADEFVDEIKRFLNAALEGLGSLEEELERTSL